MLVPPEKNAFLNLLQSRQVFAYPTEAVYGLGGDPRAPEVFAEILRLKGARQPGQGMLLVAADWAQCADWVDGLSAALIAKLQALAADRATTFILPAAATVPDWLRDVQHYFPALPVIAGETGGEARPSRLWDVANATALRN